MPRFLMLSLLALGASCMSSAPTAGDNRVLDELARFDLTPGPKVLSIVGGVALADSAASTGCAPAGSQSGSTSVLTRVDLELRAGTWVAKSIAPADGDLTLMLQSAGPYIPAVTRRRDTRAPRPSPRAHRVTHEARRVRSELFRRPSP